MDLPFTQNPLEPLIRKLKVRHDLTAEDHQALLRLPHKLRALDATR